MDRCGVCGDEFDTGKEYLDHLCGMTGYTPRDKEHNEKRDEILKTNPRAMWSRAPGPNIRAAPPPAAAPAPRPSIRAPPMKEVPVIKEKLSWKDRRKIKKARKKLYGKEGRRS